MSAGNNEAINLLSHPPYDGRLIFEAHRLFVSLNVRLKDLLGPVTRVKKKKKKR